MKSVLSWALRPGRHQMQSSPSTPSLTPALEEAGWPRVARWADVFSSSHNSGVFLRDPALKFWLQIQNVFLKYPAGQTNWAEGDFGPQVPEMSEGGGTLLW